MARFRDSARLEEARFCVYQIKCLVSNTRGEPVYIRFFDIVINDIYGVKKVARRIANSMYDQETVEILEEIGLSNWMRLLDNDRYCMLVREFMMMTFDRKKTFDEIQKIRKKGKQDKNLTDKYKWLSKNYEKRIKIMRKMLGVKDIKESYKQKYRALMDLGGGYSSDDDFDGGFSFFESDEDYDLYDPYDDYENGHSNFSEFQRRFSNENRRKTERPRRRYDDDDDFDMDEFSDFDEYGPYKRNRPFRSSEKESDPALNDIWNRLESISDVLHSLTSKREYDSMNEQDEEIDRSDIEKIISEIQKLQKSNGIIAKEIDNIHSWASYVDETMEALFEEEEESPNTEVEMGPVEVVEASPSNEEAPASNSNQELRPDPNFMSARDKIQELNRG